jgi:hypothetical protein
MILILLLVFTGCNGQNDDFLNEKSSILKNQSENLIKLSQIASVIDNDDASYWAYKYADSTLSTIDESGKSYYKDLTKIYSAYSYIFYGMSYKRTVMSISRGDDYSFEDLNQTIINPSSKKIVDLSNLSKNELSSIHSIINFYKVSRMPRYDNMQDMFKHNKLENESIFKNNTPEQAYRITSFNNKKLFFKIFAGLIIDIYSINNQDVDDTTYNDYMKTILKLGEKMDEIPFDNAKITKLNNLQYYAYILKSSEVQKAMLNLLAKEIDVLKQRNE